MKFARVGGGPSRATVPAIYPIKIFDQLKNPYTRHLITSDTCRLCFEYSILRSHPPTPAMNFKTFIINILGLTYSPPLPQHASTTLVYST